MRGVSLSTAATVVLFSIPVATSDRILSTFVGFPSLRTKNGGTSSHIQLLSASEERLLWLADRLRLDPEQVVALTSRHPRLLLAPQRTLEPTMAFYEDALGDADAAALLVETPSLLECNVGKRLRPRLQRLRQILGEAPLDAATVRSLAQKTDSRFDEWLGDLRGDEPQQRRHLGSEILHTPAAYVVLSNLQSGGNIGTILRSASIFGCRECLIVGQKRYRLAGEHDSRHTLPRRHFWSHQEARDYLLGRGIRIYGIEITADATPIMTYDRQTGVVQFPFDPTNTSRGAAFVFGNEGSGLSSKQREICDEFVLIPQARGATERSGAGSASLNVACAATVVLQAYSMWAGYPNAKLEGEKFSSR